MASCFKTFSEDKICAINKAVVQKKTKRATTFGLSVFIARYKIIFMLNLQQHRKMHLTKNPRNVCEL